MTEPVPGKPPSASLTGGSTPGRLDSGASPAGSWRVLDKARISLALLDARNRALQLYAALMAADPAGHARWAYWIGRTGWHQEFWIARNTRRARGPSGTASSTRLASIDPMADRRWGVGPASAAGVFDPLAPLPGAQVIDAGLPPLSEPELRAYLLHTLESTQDLLERADESDTALAVFRYVLHHENMSIEGALAAAQAQGVPLKPAFGPEALPPAGPVGLPATRWWHGGPDRGFVFDHERGGQWVDVPEFDIDAHPVTWGQYAEFVDDAGYDRAQLWSPQGWEWLQAQLEGRRGPRHVEQIGGAAAVVAWFGQARRMASRQAVMHVSWWEADAWCRWAGRRLPADVEWDLAMRGGAGRGARWGAVREWTGSTFRALGGGALTPDAWRDPHDTSLDGRHRSVRGASFATPELLRDPALRLAVAPGDDHLFVGFRSCAV